MKLELDLCEMTSIQLFFRQFIYHLTMVSNIIDLWPLVWDTLSCKLPHSSLHYGMKEERQNFIERARFSFLLLRLYLSLCARSASIHGAVELIEFGRVRGRRAVVYKRRRKRTTETKRWTKMSFTVLSSLSLPHIAVSHRARPPRNPAR